MGCFKGRWECLRELRCQISTETNVDMAIACIIACCVLHNVCNALGDSDEGMANTLDDAVDTMQWPFDSEESRLRFQDDVLAFMRATGEFKAYFERTHNLSLQHPEPAPIRTASSAQAIT